MDWIKANLTTILITLVGVVGTFQLYGYRIDSMEKDQVELEARVGALETQQNDVRVQLAQIATDIQYIKLNLERLLAK
jgi:hypothetical protein